MPPPQSTETHRVDEKSSSSSQITSWRHQGWKKEIQLVKQQFDDPTNEGRVANKLVYYCLLRQAEAIFWSLEVENTYSVSLRIVQFVSLKDQAAKKRSLDGPGAMGCPILHHPRYWLGWWWSFDIWRARLTRRAGEIFLKVEETLRVIRCHQCLIIWSISPLQVMVDNDGLQEGSQRKEARQLYSLYCVLCRWFVCKLGWLGVGGWFLASDGSSISRSQFFCWPGSKCFRACIRFASNFSGSHLMACQWQCSVRLALRHHKGVTLLSEESADAGPRILGVNMSWKL